MKVGFGPTPLCVTFYQTTHLMLKKVRRILLHRCIDFMNRKSVKGSVSSERSILNVYVTFAYFIICLFAVHELLAQEGPTLLDMRIKHLIKQKCVEKAAVLAKTCAEFPEFGGKKNFKQIYLVCLCETMSQKELIQEVSIY